MGQQQAIASTIKRASDAAQRAMERLDTDTADELTQLYDAAAEEVRVAIAQASQNGRRVELHQLQGLLRRVEAVLDALATQRSDVIEAAIEQAAELGIEPVTAAVDGAGAGAGGAAGQVKPALQVKNEAVEFVHNFRDVDGLALSDRLWRVGRGAREAVTRHIEQAVTQGWGADQAALQFVTQGQAVPAATGAAQRAADVDRVMRGADLLQDPSASPLASALRVMRTEINRAHGEAYMAGSASLPDVVGFKFLLSPRHPRPDVCDLLARQNLHGLGEGVYPDRKRCPWPAHPNTLSFVVAVMAHQVSEADQAGRETTLQALDRLGPEIRAGVLGPTKAEYFDRGLLRTGMVRATVGAVRQRLGRRG